MSDAPPTDLGPVTSAGEPVNRKAIFIASFLTLIAAGVGFAVRGGILGNWADQYGFTNVELGTITGGGLVGFGVVILIASFITDRVGYKTILLVAFLLHILSAAITLAATPVFNASGKDATYWCLYTGMFLFAVGNGLCEAVINPLVATLYPRQKTHYLNILHAGWPGGLIIGGLLAYFYGQYNSGVETPLAWEVPMLLFLVPTVIYGLLVIKEKFPVSEAMAAGVSYGTQLAQLVMPLMLVLLFLQACVGYVELGTDSWISNITEKIAEGQGLFLFIYASTLMFILRFFAGPIAEKINPIGLLFVSAVLGMVGLYMIGSSTTTWMVWLSMTIYGFGKTFLWPTMLGVVGERFPKGGAITMGAVGGVGMLSAGFLGGPGIGYTQDYYASQNLQEASTETFDRYKADKENSFLMFPKVTGIDGAKKGVILDSDGPGATLAANAKKLTDQGAENPQADLVTWFDGVKGTAESDKPLIEEADEFGGRMALKWTAVVPLTMAVLYLILVAYFRSQGGYKEEVIGHGGELGEGGEQYTGGVEAPVQA